MKLFSGNAQKILLIAANVGIGVCLVVLFCRSPIVDLIANSWFNAFVEQYIEQRALTVDFWSNRVFSWSCVGLAASIMIMVVAFYWHIRDIPVLKREPDFSASPELVAAFTPTARARCLWRWVVFAITGLFCFFIIYHADWTFGDDHALVCTTAINKYYGLIIIPAIGRFFPLGYIHYDIALLIWRCLGFDNGLPVTAHFAVIALLYALTVYFLFRLFAAIAADTRSPLPFPLFAGFFLLTTPATLTVFMNLIFPETLVVMLLSAFMFYFYQFLRTQKTSCLILALLAAAYCTYCKEPIFGALLIIAGVNLLFNLRSQTRKERGFYLLLVANGIVFIALYYYLCYQHIVVGYNVGRVQASIGQMTFSIFNETPILYLIFILGIVRLWGMVINRERDYLYYDSLLFAAMGYVGAIIALHLNAAYYFLPAVILSLPALVFWMQHWYARRKIYALCLILPLTVICLGNVGQTVIGIRSTLEARQEFMPYIRDLAEKFNTGKVLLWYVSDHTVNDNKFYIAARNWRKHVENAFLNYNNRTTGIEHFIVAKNDEADDGRFLYEPAADRALPPPSMRDWDERYLFFYPIDNDQNQPMPAALAQRLADNHFSLYSDRYGVLIYRKEQPQSVAK